jgi:large subunit ribosomal protein L5
MSDVSEGVYIPRLHLEYRRKAIPALREKFEYPNVMQVPRLSKIVVNLSMKDATQNVKLLETAAGELTTIVGQKAVITRARRSIANFKLREGMPLGARVTLRRQRMWEFLDRLISVAMPRIRDFRGISPRAFDGRGNYSLGLTEQIVFPEIDYDKVSRTTGMNVAFVTTAQTDEEGRELLRQLGMPFAN